MCFCCLKKVDAFLYINKLKQYHDRLHLQVIRFFREAVNRMFHLSIWDLPPSDEQTHTARPHMVVFVNSVNSKDSRSISESK